MGVMLVVVRVLVPVAMVVLAPVAVLVRMPVPMLVRMPVSNRLFMPVQPRHVVVVVLVRLVKYNVKVTGSKSALLDAAHHNLKSVNGKRDQRLAQPFLASAQVEKGGHRHVSADARAAVQHDCLSHSRAPP